MYHLMNNLYFGRLADGKVRLLKLATTPDAFPAVDALDVVIDDGHWGSVVAAVSKGGEENGRWYQAMDFHHGRFDLRHLTEGLEFRVAWTVAGSPTSFARCKSLQEAIIKQAQLTPTLGLTPVIEWRRGNSEWEMAGI
jgi:hypothetical protein